KEVVNAAQELCNSKMLLILTFDEMQNAFQRKWDCKRVEDYAKVSYFEQDVKQFFAESDSDKFINSEDLTQFFQIKWILETAHTSYYKDYNKHEDEEKYKDERINSDAQKSKGKKLVVLIVRSVHKLQYPFPMIFTKKWTTVFVDSLTNQSSFSLKDLLQKDQLTMIDDLSFIPVIFVVMLKKNLQRAFYYLKFPNFHYTFLKMKHGFGDSNVLPKTMHDMMIERLKKEVSKMTDGYTICDILNKKLYKKLLLFENGQQFSFIQNYKHVVDSLITKGWLHVLLALYENYYLEAALDNPKQSRLVNIFVDCAKDEQFVAISNHENIPSKNLHFFRARALYKAQFPFSWNFHVYYAAQILKYCTLCNERNEWKNVTINDPITAENSITVNKELNMIEFLNKSSSILEQCDEGECAKYAKDVIRGMFHRYISVQENDDIPDIVQNIVFWIGGVLMEETDATISIPMVETILYYFENVIGTYTQLLSLCDDQEIRSSIKRFLSNMPSTLTQLMDVTLKLSKYFLWHPFQLNDVDDFSRKIHLACDVLQIIANFLQKRCEERDYQEFLSVFRQLQMKNLGLKHFWTIDCYSTPSKENVVATNTLTLAKRGFATDNILIQIIDLIIESHPLSISLVQKAIYFIRDLLHTIQQVETFNEQTVQLMFENVIEYIVGKIEELPDECPKNVLKLQALENISGNTSLLQYFLEKHCKANVEVNRMFEKMFTNPKVLELDEISSSNETEKIKAISKLKVQLTKYIYFLCENASTTTGDLPMYEAFKSTLEKISDGLLYFKSKKAQFGNDLNVYEQYLHIWFLKQCCMLKGPCWTQIFFTQSEIRKRYPIFVSEMHSYIFSYLKPKDNNLSSIDTIKNCVIEEKEDFVPFLIAAFSVSSPNTSRKYLLSYISIVTKCHSFCHTHFSSFTIFFI
ncbi:hypothetical protein RFI_02991, partial [Reticulomyxa filosa]